MNEHKYTDEELRELNDWCFEQDRAAASECPQRGYGPSINCDGCSLIHACSTLPTGY